MRTPLFGCGAASVSGTSCHRNVLVPERPVPSAQPGSAGSARAYTMTFWHADRMAAGTCALQHNACASGPAAAARTPCIDSVKELFVHLHSQNATIIQCQCQLPAVPFVWLRIFMLCADVSGFVLLHAEPTLNDRLQIKCSTLRSQCQCPVNGHGVPFTSRISHVTLRPRSPATRRASLAAPNRSHSSRRRRAAPVAHGSVAARQIQGAMTST